MKTTEAVRGQWPLIFEFYNLPPVTGNRHFKGECPICSKKSKFRIDDKNGSGSFVCVCGAGDGWKLLDLTQCKDFKTIAREIDKLLGNDWESEKQFSMPQVKPKHQTVMERFNSLSTLKGTEGESYLRGRGLFDMPKKGVKYNPSEAAHGNYSSIYSIATDDKFTPCYLHRTLLEGDKKASHDKAKTLLGLQAEDYLKYAGSVAIRMFPASSTMGIAEGIETALSARQIYKCNTWSVLNTSIMKRFRAPAGVNHLMIFADTDSNGAGHAAAFECGHRNILANNDVKKVSIRWPANKGDFNDMLQDGSEVFEWVLNS